MPILLTGGHMLRDESRPTPVRGSSASTSTRASASRLLQSADALARRVRLEIGIAAREERRRRRLTQREVGAIAGIDQTTVHNVEIGEAASIDVIARIACALRLDLAATLVNSRRRESLSIDPVHSAMGEIEAQQFQRLGFATRLDEPYQHFQFSGRADVVALSLEKRLLLHLENRTQFPDTQAALGAFNSKRAYLGRDLAARLGLPGWRSECHVIVALWSAEVLHVLRLRPSTFRATCPDGGSSFEDWWAGRPPASGVQSGLILFDPLEGVRADRARWVSLEAASTVRARYRDYTDALESLRKTGRC